MVDVCNALLEFDSGLCELCLANRAISFKFGTDIEDGHLLRPDHKIQSATDSQIFPITCLIIFYCIKLNSSVNAVCADGVLSDWFTVGSGVRQGSRMAPDLFLGPMDGDGIYKEKDKVDNDGVHCTSRNGGCNLRK